MADPKFLRSQFTDLFGATMLPVLEELFRSELELHPQRRPELFKIVPHDRDIWQSTELHDLPQYNSMSEGENYTFERQQQGYDKTLVIQKFGLGFSISEEAVDDGKFDYIADAVRKLAESGRETQEVNAMAVFNNGFGSQTTPDGQPLFSTSHTTSPAAGAQTYSNRPTTAADLTISSLKEGIADFRKNFVGDTGHKKLLVPKVLLVPEELRLEATELIRSEKSPGTADNNMNSVAAEGLRVVSSPHLTDADQWTLLESPNKTGLRIIARKPIETKVGGADIGFINDAIFYKARYREKIDTIHPYGVYGSPGA